MWIKSHRTRSHCIGRAAQAALALCTLFLIASPAWSQEGDQETPTTTRPWIDADGQRLPFTTGEEVEDFLRDAKVVAVEDIPVGVSKPKKVTMVRGDLRAHAVYRTPDERYRGVRLDDGTVASNLRDSYRFEVAAYQLSRLLGMDAVPPAINRSIQGQKKAGSLQIWIENAMSEKKRQEEEINPPDVDDFWRQIHDMRVWDNLIHNVDRNLGNILIDADWKVWYIDHTRTFGTSRRLFKPRRIAKISRPLWDAIRALDQETLKREIDKDVLPGYLIKPLLLRRDAIVEILEERIAEAGEAAVILD